MILKSNNLNYHEITLAYKIQMSGALMTRSSAHSCLLECSHEFQHTDIYVCYTKYSNVTWDLHYIWDDYLQNDKNKVPSGSICHKWVCRIGWKLEPGLADIEIELGSEMSAEWSVMSDVSESVVCMSFELSFRGMKPYMCGRGWEISALAPLLGTSCSGLPSSKLLDEILLKQTTFCSQNLIHLVLHVCKGGMESQYVLGVDLNHSYTCVRGDGPWSDQEYLVQSGTSLED